VRKGSRAGATHSPAVVNAGLAPSLVALTATWAASVFTGLLLAEVTASVSGSGGEENAAPSFVSLARATLGPAGSTVALGAQFLLQYLLLIAYTSKGGEVLSRFLILPPAAGAATFAAVLGLFVGAASPAQLDAGNGALLALLLLSFVLLLGDALPTVSPEALSAVHWSAVLPALPVISLAFVYHNVVPLTVRAVRGHAPSLRFALFWGTALPLVMYAMWEVAILGQPGLGMRDARALATVDAFSLLAVATSYLGFSLSLSDMLADLRRGVQEAPRAADVQSTPPGALLAALLPPLAAAVYFKDIFISALESAGLFGALLLGGILPGVMAISDRRRRRRAGEGVGALSTPGGDVAAAAVAALAGSIILADVLGLLH